MKALLVLACLIVLAVVASGCRPCELRQRTEAAVDTMIAPSMTIVSPMLSPDLQAKYAVLKGAFELARAALDKACSPAAATDEKVVAATQAAVNLVEFYKDTVTREVAVQALRSRGLAMPRAVEDVGPVLARAAGAKPKPVDLGELLTDLKAVQARSVR